MSAFLLSLILLLDLLTYSAQARAGAAFRYEQEGQIAITDALVEGDKLTYKGYVVQKRYKKVKLDYPPESKEPSGLVDVSYAVLKRRGKVLAKFDGIYFGAGNETSFGLFSFLGGSTKQLVVSQDIPRGGNQWIVSLSPRFRVIYDGFKFSTGREAYNMGVIDLDHDGIYEITQPITAFYEFSKWLPVSRTPLPTVVFKYDAKAGRYLPANRRFQAYLLRDVKKAKKQISGPENRIKHLADILPIVLDYIFAGKEKDAWAFYEMAYKLPDKAEVKGNIKAVLKKQPVYRYIYRKSVKG